MDGTGKGFNSFLGVPGKFSGVIILPNTALLEGNSLKITMDLYCVIPPK